MLPLRNGVNALLVTRLHFSTTTMALALAIVDSYITVASTKRTKARVCVKRLASHFRSLLSLSLTQTHALSLFL